MRRKRHPTRDGGAAAAGLTAPALSHLAISRPAPQGLMLGSAAVPEAEIAPAVRTLAAAFDRRELRGLTVPT